MSRRASSPPRRTTRDPTVDSIFPLSPQGRVPNGRQVRHDAGNVLAEFVGKVVTHVRNHVQLRTANLTMGALGGLWATADIFPTGLLHAKP
jgi:hypothetical protein